MDIDAQKYAITQNENQYILYSEKYEDKIRLKCKEINKKNSEKFIGEFSLFYLKQISPIFNSISTIKEALHKINETIESQKLKIDKKRMLLIFTCFFQIIIKSLILL